MKSITAKKVSIIPWDGYTIITDANSQALCSIQSGNRVMYIHLVYTKVCSAGTLAHCTFIVYFPVQCARDWAYSGGLPILLLYAFSGEPWNLIN